jgi:uncharacterized MAPEG superfamily protein
MTIAFWCVLIAALMPYAFTGAAKFSGGRYNNYKPREWLDKLEGWQKRAHWVQLNSFEAFPPFAAAVIIAQLAQAPQATIDGLAIAFIALRLLYGLCYIFNKATLRTLVWTAAFGCVVAMFVVAA